jgi:hypothetical protein
MSLSSLGFVADVPRKRLRKFTTRLLLVSDSDYKPPTMQRDSILRRSK